MKNTKKGFTLVELLVVIAIIAILATVSIVSYVSFINRANMSVDQQVVDQMNKVFAADEIVADKPATVAEAKNLLIANRLDDFSPIDERNVFYWVGSENRVVLWTKDEVGSETGKVSYPKEYAKKYKDVTTPSADWSDLSLDYNVEVIAPEEGESLKDALINAVKDAPDGAIIQLPENSELQMSQGGLYWLGQALTNDSGVAKHITIDLNGSTLVSSGSNAAFTQTEDGSGWLTDEDGDYVMNIVEVPANGELVITNGSLDIQHGNRPSTASLITSTGSKLVIRDVNIDTSTAGILPAGDASEVVIENSTINALNYALSTNRAESSRIRIVINNSTLSATYATAVMINTAADAHIYNSTITGVVHGVVLRAGSLEVKDSTIITNDTNPGIYAANDFASGYGFQGFWGTGNTIPAGTIVVGDYTKPNPDGTYSYSGDSVLTLINTKLQSAAGDAMPEILLAAYDPNKTASVTYDGSCSVGDIVVYGSNWAPTSDNVGVTFNHSGEITVNGESK